MTVAEHTQRRRISNAEEDEDAATTAWDPTGEVAVSVSFGALPTLRLVVAAGDVDDRAVRDWTRTVLHNAWEDRERSQQQRLKEQQEERRAASERVKERHRRRNELLTAASAWHEHQRRVAFVAAVETASRSYDARRRQLAESWAGRMRSYLRGVNPIDRMFT